MLFRSARLALAAEALLGEEPGPLPAPDLSRGERATWRMPPLELLERPVMSTQRKVGLLTLRAYLVLAVVLVIVKVVTVSVG